MAKRERPALMTLAEFRQRQRARARVLEMGRPARREGDMAFVDGGCTQLTMASVNKDGTVSVLSGAVDYWVYMHDRCVFEAVYHPGTNAPVNVQRSAEVELALAVLRGDITAAKILADKVLLGD